MPAKTTCVVMGAVFLVVAIWGFIDGDHVLIFSVNWIHNLVHLVSGLAALAFGFAGAAAARAFCVVFGVVYGLVALLGFAGVPSVINLLHINPPDNWLHLGITLAFLLAAAASMRHAKAGAAVNPPPETPPSPPRP